MGFVSGLLGTAGGINGTGVSGPAQAAIQTPTTGQQATDTYNQSQNALQQQQSFVNALQQQNGIGNQSSVFNQLQGVANGTGPNPAQAQLAQSTGANVANQAALMAGQRGSSANAGLIARQAAQQGAATQQNAAGQAATLQATQSLNALNSLGGLANTQVAQQQQAVTGLNSAAQGEQGQVLGSIGAQNSALVGSQSSVNNANAGLASSTMSGQQNMLGNVVGGVGSALGLAQGGAVPHMDTGGLLGANINQPLVDPGSMPNFTQMPAPVPISPSSTPQSNVGKYFGGKSSSTPLTGSALAGNTIGKGIGAAISSIFKSSPSTPQTSQWSQAADGSAPVSLDQMAASPAATDSAGMVAGGSDTPMMGDAMMAAKGGRVPVILSPGEKKLSPKLAEDVAKGKASPMKDGKTVPGKPVVGGAKNDYANDTVPDEADPGTVIVPRSITQMKDAKMRDEKAVAFVRDSLAKQGLKQKPKKPSK